MEPPFLVLRGANGRSVRLALPIAELFALQRAARTLMGRALSGDAQAKGEVEQLFALADDPNSNEQPRAIVSAYLLHESMREIQEQRAAWAQQAQQSQAQQAQAQAAPPEGGPEPQATPTAEARGRVRRPPPAPAPPLNEMDSCPHGFATDLPCGECESAAAGVPVPRAQPAPPPPPMRRPIPQPANGAR